MVGGTAGSAQVIGADGGQRVHKLQSTRTSGRRAMRCWQTMAAVLALAAPPAIAQPARAAYAEGQVWEYKTRPEDVGSLLRIQTIEELPGFAKLGPVYHISIVGVHYPGLSLGSELQHAPVSRQTLDASVTRLSSSAAKFPDPAAGITEWRAANGGVFTIPVSDIVAAVGKTVMQGGAGGQ